VDEPGAFLCRHHGFPCPCITCEMNNRPVGGRSSETLVSPHRHDHERHVYILLCMTVKLDVFSEKEHCLRVEYFDLGEMK
jgi:hypothetical protein